MGSNTEKSNIAIAILKKLQFLMFTKIISHFDGSNKIFVDCILLWCAGIIILSEKDFPLSFCKIDLMTIIFRIGLCQVL